METENIAISGDGHGVPAGYLPGPGGGAPYGLEEPHVELRDYLRIFMRRRWIFTVTFAGVFASALAYVITAPRVYRATARVRVLQPPRPALAALMPEASTDSQDFLRTEAKIVESSLLAEETARMVRRAIPGMQAEDISDALRVSIEDPDVLAINIEDTDPDRAALVANAVQKAYIHQNIETSQKEARDVKEFLEGQLPRLEKEYREAEQQVRAFRERHRIAEVDKVVELEARRAAELLSDAEKAEADLRAAESTLRSLKARLATVQPTRIVPRVMSDPVAERFRQELSAAEVELAKAEARYEPTHPKVQSLRDNLNELREEQKKRFGNRMSSFRLEQVEEPNPAFEGLQERVREQQLRVDEAREVANTLRKMAEEKRKLMPDSPGTHVQLVGLERRKEVAEKTYFDTLQQYNSAQIAVAQKQPTVRELDVARRPTDPVRPRPVRTLALAAIVGMLAGLAAALLQEYSDTSVHDPDELMLRTGIPSLGFIPAARDPNLSPKIAARSPKSPMSEGFRSIRSNLKFAHLDSPLRTIMVTSAGAGEGKSFTATNMAIVFAQAGIKTLLVDADLRRPTLHRTFGFDHTPGLTNVLAGEIGLVEAIRTTDVPGLELLPSGSTPPNPSELLDSQRMAHLVEQLQQRADVIIVDTPPALVVTDAVVLSRRMDSTVLVVEQGKVNARALGEIRRMVEQARGRVAGAVINKVRASAGDYYYQYYYRYYYYYGSREGKQLGGWKTNAHTLPDPSDEPVALPSEGKGDA